MRQFLEVRREYCVYASGEEVADCVSLRLRLTGLSRAEFRPSIDCLR